MRHRLPESLPDRVLDRQERFYPELGRSPKIKIGSPGADSATAAVFTLQGRYAAEAWNKLGIGLVPTLKRGKDLSIGVDDRGSHGVVEREEFEREIRRRLAA